MSRVGNVLVVDDDVAVGEVLTALLGQANYGARHTETATRALELVESDPVDVVITDLRMPGTDGMTLLSTLRTRRPDLPVIMLTAHGTIERAVEAMKNGATEFLLKPFDRDEVLFCVGKAMAAAERAAEGPPASAAAGTELIGSSAPMRDLDAQLTRVAASHATILLTGETGTGKELAARTIHRRSTRAGGPFIAVHCAALPETLLESELFGYEKGAFTGATRAKPGRVALAEGGTLFLDEIGEMPLVLQAKILRLLQEREYQPVGGERSRRADVRFIAATHRDLEAMVTEGTFREDLYYRLAVVPVQLPPLRERKADIPRLARHFWGVHCETHGRRNLQLTEEAIRELEGMNWPGNVRELQNLLERLSILAEGPAVGPDEVASSTGRDSAAPRASAADTLETRVREAERKALREALDRAGDNRSLAARLLGVSRRTLYNKLTEHGLV